MKAKRKAKSGQTRMSAPPRVIGVPCPHEPRTARPGDRARSARVGMLARLSHAHAPRFDLAADQYSFGGRGHGTHLEALEGRMLLSGSDPVINEFLASNQNTSFLDDYSTRQDWVEIYNPASSAVNVGG